MLIRGNVRIVTESAGAEYIPRYVCNKKQAMYFRKISFCIGLHG